MNDHNKPNYKIFLYEEFLPRSWFAATMENLAGIAPGYEDTRFSKFHYGKWAIFARLTRASRKAAQKKSIFQRLKLAYVNHADMPLSANYISAVIGKLNGMANNDETEIPPLTKRNKANLAFTLFSVLAIAILMGAIVLFKELIGLLIVSPIKYLVFRPIYNLLYLANSNRRYVLTIDEENILKATRERPLSTYFVQGVLLHLYRIKRKTLAVPYDLLTGIVLGTLAIRKAMSMPSKFNEQNIKTGSENTIVHKNKLVLVAKLCNSFKNIFSGPAAFLPSYARRTTKHSQSTRSSFSFEPVSSQARGVQRIR